MFGLSRCGVTARRSRKPRRGYRRKYPNWTENKIEKAVQNALKQARKKSSAFMPGYYAHNVERDAIASFLRELSSAGSVVLLLDDGGLVDPRAGGTRGLPDAKREPRIGEGYSVKLSQVRIENVVPLPYWVPVTIQTG